MPSNYLQNFYRYRLLTRRRDHTHHGTLWARRRRNARRKSVLLFFVMMQAAISFLFGRRVRSVWMFVWWEDVVLNSFGPCDWRENFCVSKATFDYICFNLKPLVEKQNTSMRRPVSVERRVAITLWILATPSEYRSIAHLFGIRSSVHSVCDCP